jgi:hypothetical protein
MTGAICSLRHRYKRREILIGQKDRTQKDIRLIFLRSIFLPIQASFYAGEWQDCYSESDSKIGSLRFTDTSGLFPSPNHVTMTPWTPLL